MTRDIPVEDLPKEIQKDAPLIRDGFLSEIDALEENADREEGKRPGTGAAEAKPAPKAG